MGRKKGRSGRRGRRQGQGKDSSARIPKKTEPPKKKRGHRDNDVQLYPNKLKVTFTRDEAKALFAAAVKGMQSESDTWTFFPTNGTSHEAAYRALNKLGMVHDKRRRN